MKIEIELDNLTAEEQETARNWANRSERYWIPKFGEYYFSLGPNGSIDEVQNDEDAIDAFNLSTGNFFRNVEDAKEHHTRLKMRQLLKKLSIEAGEATNPWDGHKSHYFAYWSCVDKKIRIDSNEAVFCEKTYFPTRKSLESAIAELGEENVKRYILGVTELHQLLTDVEVEDDDV